MELAQYLIEFWYGMTLWGRIVTFLMLAILFSRSITIRHKDGG